MNRLGARARDWVIPAALALMTVVDAAASGAGAFPEPVAVAATALVLLSLVLGLRRRHPVAVAVATSAGTAAYLLAVQRDLSQQPPVEPFLVLIVAFFSLGARADRRSLMGAGTVSAALLVTAEGTALVQGRPLGDVLPSLIFWVAAAVAGRLLYYRQREAAAERARAQLAEADRELHARQATLEERTRIARELHDVVAHSLSVIVIQAGVEARVQAGSSAQTLRLIEETGRDALVELRRLLGLLRTDDAVDGSLQPLPGLRHLDALLDQLRIAGLDVTLEVSGEERAVPTGVDLSAYRIAQEALTNALKHAPGSIVRVRLDYTDESLSVHVEDDGARPRTAGHRASANAAGGNGHGMLSMTERVKLYGGELMAGPRTGGGFVVHALIPTAADAG
jgi:signal transduction histidine kinase